MMLGIVAIATLILIGFLGFIMGKSVTEKAIEEFKESRR